MLDKLLQDRFQPANERQRRLVNLDFLVIESVVRASAITITITITITKCENEKWEMRPAVREAPRRADNGSEQAKPAL